MHHKDILLIRIGVTVAAVAQKHHLSSEELLIHLKQLFPTVDEAVLRQSAIIGVTPSVTKSSNAQ